MTSPESLRLVHRLIRADFALCHAMRTNSNLEAAAHEERMAAANLLLELLGRVPTAEELGEVLGIGGKK